MAGGATDPEAERLKGQGNEKLKAGSVREALEIYEKALARLPVKASAGSALSTLSASLCLNAALACLQLETWEAAERFASRALRSEETSKGYFRRGLARAQMNGLEADAKRDFEFALKLEPKGSTAAVLVQAELAKLLSNSAASGYEAPPGTDPRRAKKFQIANASKQQQGLREVTFAEWDALEEKVAAANAIASAWRKRLEEASNCPRPEQGADDARGLSKLLEQLASKVSKPRAASNDMVPVDQVALSPCSPASGIRGEIGALQLLVPGPFLFDGKSSVEVAFDPLANPTGSFAVECWAVCTAATGHQCLLSSRDQTSGKAGYMFYVEPDGLWSFWVGTGKSWAKLYGSTAVLGKWTHLRGTVDVQSKEARLYVDRTLVARGWASYVPNTRQALRLGAGKSEAEAKFFFTGDLRDVAVIGRLVSNEDLTDEMLKLAKVSGPQAVPDLDQLPKLLRQEKGRGLQNASGALASALQWATDALVRDLKNEIQELRKQLEQAKEKHDDEALKEIADHLEASHAIVAAQTRDWVDFEEENAELSKKRARSFIRSSSHEMFPYLANHSEDPHLCFKLVMHVPEGKEQSLGSDISSDFRLPPALGVCETTGYIRNQGGCLTLRPAAAPSGRFASIEVNGTKLSREQELHHLDCVLFGRSTTFYVFLQHASAEEVDERLRASRADMEDWDERITQPLVDKILGEGVLVPANAEDFRRSSLRLMECSPTAQGMRLLFLSFSIGAVLAAQGDELHMNFAGSGLRYWAVILQSGDCFKILYDVERISSLQEALSRQQKLRADGWLTRKDLAMWLGALDTLAFGLSEDELEDALLTVFLFGFWASKMLTPQVRIKRFEGQSRSSQVQAALVEDVPSEALGKLLQTLTEEAQK